MGKFGENFQLGLILPSLGPNSEMFEIENISGG